MEVRQLGRLGLLMFVFETKMQIGPQPYLKESEELSLWKQLDGRLNPLSHNQSWEREVSGINDRAARPLLQPSGRGR